MRRPNHSYSEESKYFIPYTCDVLPEQVIIDLHEIFLTKGTHVLEIATYEYGRKLIIDILHSIKYYQNMGYLSLDAPIIAYEKALFHDIQSILIKCGYLHENESNFEQFFIDAFFFDFIIIEQSKQMTNMPWYKHFTELMHQFSLESQLPIVIIQTEGDS